MDREQLKQTIIDLRHELKTNFDKYVEAVSTRYKLDYSDLWTDSVREDRLEWFIEQTESELDEFCFKHNAFVDDVTHEGIRASTSFNVYSDNLMYEDDLTLDMFLRYTVANEYQHSIMIDYLAKDDEYILNLIDELELDDATLRNELDQLSSLANTFKKTIDQLRAVRDDVDYTNANMKALFKEYCYSFD